MNTYPYYPRILAVLALFSLLLNNVFAAEPDNQSPLFRKKQKSTKSDFVFQLHCADKRQVSVDSAIIILDKYDFTGPATVVQVAITDSNYNLNLKDVPAGKYFAGIYTYGLKKEYIETVIVVTAASKRKKTNFKRIKVTYVERFIKGIPMPEENIELFALIKAIEKPS